MIRKKKYWKLISISCYTFVHDYCRKFTRVYIFCCTAWKYIDIFVLDVAFWLCFLQMLLHGVVTAYHKLVKFSTIIRKCSIVVQSKFKIETLKLNQTSTFRQNIYFYYIWTRVYGYISGVSLHMRPANCNHVSHWHGAYLDWSVYIRIDLWWLNNSLIKSYFIMIVMTIIGIFNGHSILFELHIWAFCDEVVLALQLRISLDISAPSLDIFFEYEIKHITFGHISFLLIRILYRVVPGFATDCLCRVWCCKLTTCLLYVGSFFKNLVWNESGFVNLT